MHYWILSVLIQQDKTEITLKSEIVISQGGQQLWWGGGLCFQINCAESSWPLNKEQLIANVVSLGKRCSIHCDMRISFLLSLLPSLYTFLKSYMPLSWKVCLANTIKKLTSSRDEAQRRTFDGAGNDRNSLKLQVWPTDQQHLHPLGIC